MADRNPILPPASEGDVQFRNHVLGKRDIQLAQEIRRGSDLTSSLELQVNGIIDGTIQVGSLVIEATVLTYDSTTGTGTADHDGTTINFYNGEPLTLVAGDVVAIAETTSGKQVVVGVITRPGSVTPVAVPVVTTPPDFPVRTDGLTYPIKTEDLGDRISLAVDLTGNLGYGTDLIIGPHVETTTYQATNAVLRSGATNLNLSNTNYGPRYFIDSNGRLIIINTSSQLVWRDPSTGTWTTQTYTGAVWAWDRDNEILWFQTVGYTGGPFFKFAPTDSTPVAMGALGTGVSNVTNPGNRGIVAGRGKVAFQSSNNSNGVWVKSSTDGTNFVSNGTAASSYVASATSCIASDGDIYNLVTNSGTGNYDLRAYDHATGVTSTTNTGVAYANVSARYMQRTTTGNYVVACSAREDVVVSGGSTTRWIPAIFLFTGTATSWVYYDTVHYAGSNNGNLHLTELLETATNTFRFGGSYRRTFSSGTGNWASDSFLVHEFTIT